MFDLEHPQQPWNREINDLRADANDGKMVAQSTICQRISEPATEHTTP
jgi:hypothetical protein